jgi:hypothetical protein
MAFDLHWTPKAEEHLAELEKDQAKLKKVRKTLGLLERDPQYPGLNSHKYDSLKGPDGVDIWASYVENNTPAAFRVFWFYGVGAGVITVVAITKHP